MMEQSWVENLLRSILMEFKGLCAENYTKISTDFQKLFNNYRFRQKPVIKPILHNASWCKKSFNRRKLF